ncbi:MAG: VWA domain-containing protein, partial [Proteobacteria bacterium]|nr:VWA domain-containing protein [Pseudomonadota bacterium]
MKKTMMTILCLTVVVLAMSSSAGAHSRMITQPKPRVQIAILLDTSGSMSGLIDQARTELWAIVNEFITATRDGQAPELQVALYKYGSSLRASEGYIRMIVPLTTDLDKISEELFALKISGSKEYCGWVIKEATEELQWSPAPEDLKVIFIAGNEPFTQGKVKYQDACKAAIGKGIVVNTIHCGSSSAGVSGKWKDGAMLADGQFLNIDQNKTAVHIAAPQDAEIAELGIKLNSTY